MYCTFTWERHLLKCNIIFQYFSSSSSVMESGIEPRWPLPRDCIPKAEATDDDETTNHVTLKFCYSNWIRDAYAWDLSTWDGKRRAAMAQVVVSDKEWHWFECSPPACMSWCSGTAMCENLEGAIASMSSQACRKLEESLRWKTIVNGINVDYVLVLVRTDVT